MGALGIQSEEKWSNQGIRLHGAGFYDAGDKMILVSAAALNAYVAAVSLH